jgi:hypothetical protein
VHREELVFLGVELSEKISILDVDDDYILRVAEGSMLEFELT